jgi:hypothetical protein
MVNIEALTNDLVSILNGARQDKEDAMFYKRILVQVLLTYGKDGFLSVDYSKGKIAQDLAETVGLAFGDGGVRLVDEDYNTVVP